MHGCIALGASRNLQGSLKCFDRMTGNGVLRRAFTVLPMPEFMVKFLFGEMGELLLLGSNRINSQVLQNAGFKFEHKTIGEALSHMLMK